MKLTELLFMVLGALAIAFAGISYIQERPFVHVGTPRVTATDGEHTSRLSVVGGVAVVGGILLLAAPRKRHV